MKKIVILALSFMSSLALANPAAGQWNYWDHTVEQGSSAEEVQAIAQRHPRAFVGYEVAKITRVTLHIYAYKYSGPTNCPENDPRLITEGYQFYFNLTNGNIDMGKIYADSRTPSCR